MQVADPAPTRMSRLANIAVRAVLLTLMACMTLGLFVMSGYPQHALLSIWGTSADAEIVRTESVVYASFPYGGTVHTVAFQTLEGEAQEFERTGERVPSELGGVFEVRYLPAWPAVVQIVAEPRRSPFLFACGMLVTVLCLLSFALMEVTDEKPNLLVRIARAPGCALIAFLEHHFDRGADDAGTGAPSGHSGARQDS